MTVASPELLERSLGKMGRPEGIWWPGDEWQGVRKKYYITYCILYLFYITLITTFIHKKCQFISVKKRLNWLPYSHLKF